MKKLSLSLLCALLLSIPAFAQDGPARRIVDSTFANLGNQPNGSVRHCTNCQATSPCTSGGTGAIASRVNGAWNCSTGGGIANSAGANVVTKSNGTNLVASRITDNGTDIEANAGAGEIELQTTGIFYAGDFDGLSTNIYFGIVGQVSSMGDAGGSGNAYVTTNGTTKKTTIGASAAGDEVIVDGTADSISLNAAKTVVSGNLGVGLGTVTPPTKFTVGDTTSTTPRGLMSWQASDDTSSAHMHMRKSRGTFAAPTTIVTGDILGRMVFSGYEGSAYNESAYIRATSTGTIGSTRVPSKLEFFTSTNAAPSVATLAFTLNSDQTAAFAGNATAPAFVVSGASGAGYVELPEQASAPATPTNAARLYIDSSNRFSWKGENGFTRTFDGTANLADRVYTLPDANSSLPVYGATITYTGPTAARTVTYPDANFTVARTDAAQTFSGAQTFSSTINKLTFTAPATGSTFTLADGKTITISNTLTFTGTDSSSVAFGGGGTVVYTSSFGTNVATFLATPSSANFFAAITDESGSGLVLGQTSPTISTPRISQVMGGTAAGSILNLQSTTGVGSGDAIVFKVGNNGATEAGRFTGAGAANLKIAGTAARGTTEGTNHLDIFDGTAPVGTLANGISLYSTSGELRVMDAAGNATLLSPHDHTTNEWIFYSVNTTTGKVLRIDMERLMRDLDARMGGGYIHESNDANALTTSSAKNTATATAAPLSSIGGTQLLTPTPGATVTLTIDPTAKHIVASWTSGEAETINVSGTPQDGTVLTLIIMNDATLGRLLTAGSGLSALTTILNVVSKKSTVSFVALNGTFYETSRTVGF